MAQGDETDQVLYTHQLRQNRCACLAMAEILKKLAEEPVDDMVLQMDLLYGVAFLLDLVGLDIEQVYLGLIKAKPVR